MTKTDLESRKNKEKNRLKRLLKEAGTEDWKIKMLLPVLENTAWMCAKLEDSLEKLETEDIAVYYDNGGGQRGLRQNPHIQAYEALWKSYMAGMSQIVTAPGAQKDAKSKTLQPKSVIALVKGKQKQG